MKKYLINLSDKTMASSISKAIGEDLITDDEELNPTIIDDKSINNFLANIFNRSNGILILGSYGKTSALTMLDSVFSKNNEKPITLNLGKDKEISFGDGGFCILNPGMNTELIKLLKPSLVVLTGVINTKKTIEEQTNVYEQAIKSASVGVIINDDCPEASIFKDINPSTLVYSMKNKADILCQSFALEDKGMNIVINKELYTFNALGKDNIAAAMIGIGIGELLGINKQTIKQGIENFISPLSTLAPIGGISGVFLINDNSIYPEQIQKRLEFLTNLTQKLVVIFSPDPDFYSEKYEESFSVLPRSSRIAFCGGFKGDTKFENLCKNLRKQEIKADYYPVRRDTIKDLISKSSFGEVIVLMGTKGKDFDYFCSNLWTTLESKSL